jgi:hypothetical protein
MSTATSKLPDGLRVDPDLGNAIEQALRPHNGEDLTKAQAAVLAVRKSGVQGQFADLVTAYRDAIDEVVTAPTTKRSR